MSKFYSSGPGEDAQHYSKFRDQFRTFLTGVSVEYGPNILVPGTYERQLSTLEQGNSLHKAGQPWFSSKQSLASNIIIGQRLPSKIVMNHAEANIVHVHSMLRSDGRWRLLLLAGDISKPAQMSRLESVCD